MIDWTKVDKEHIAYKLMDLIKVQDVNCTKIRLGHPFDGGYVLLDELCEGVDVCYSFGIDWDVSFDVHFADRYGSKMRLYDPFIPCIPLTAHPAVVGHQRRGISDEPPVRCGPVKNATFYQIGIGEIQEGNLDTLDNFLTINGDKGKRMVLKMDVEGAEWGAFDTMNVNTLWEFEQITVEFHDMHTEELWDIAYRVFKKLTDNFYIYHVHQNNSHSGIATPVNGLYIPQLLEISFVRQDLVAACPTKTTFPTIYDGPNMWDKEDPPLDYWPFKREQ